MAGIGRKLGLDGTYLPRSYIEQVCLSNLEQQCMAAPKFTHGQTAGDGAPSFLLSLRAVMQTLRRALANVSKFSPDVPALLSLQSWLTDFGRLKCLTSSCVRHRSSCRS